MTNEQPPRWLDWMGGIGVGLALAVLTHELWVYAGWPCQ